MTKQKPKTMKKIYKNSLKQGLVDLLQLRIRSLEIERQLYEQNPNLIRNLKITNIALIQNDIEALKRKLRELIGEASARKAKARNRFSYLKSCS